MERPNTRNRVFGTRAVASLTESLGLGKHAARTTFAYRQPRSSTTLGVADRTSDSSHLPADVAETNAGSLD